MLMSIIDQINSAESVYDFLRYIVDHHDNKNVIKDVCKGEIFTSVHSWQYKEINDGNGTKLKVHNYEDLEFDLTSLSEVKKLIKILSYGEQITLRDDWSLVYTCG